MPIKKQFSGSKTPRAGFGGRAASETQNGPRKEVSTLKMYPNSNLLPVEHTLRPSVPVPPPHRQQAHTEQHSHASLNKLDGDGLGRQERKGRRACKHCGGHTRQNPHPQPTNQCCHYINSHSQPFCDEVQIGKLESFLLPLIQRIEEGHKMENFFPASRVAAADGLHLTFRQVTLSPNQ